MAQHMIVPSLADLDDGASGPVPLDIVLQWAESDKSAETHSRILAPHVVSGTVVNSDSVGLSRLTRERTLCEVLHRIDEPKQVIFSYGTALGGRALGLWTADNTEMWYDDSIEPQAVVEHMICAQHEIADLLLQVGIGIHCGTFIAFGDAVFGEDAALCDDLAERYTSAGEIAVTQAVGTRLDASLRSRLRPHGYPATPTFTLDYSGLEPCKEKDTRGTYPIPYTADFHQYVRTEYQANCAHKTYRKYAATKVVIQVVATLPQREFLLDSLADLALSTAIMRGVAEGEAVEIVKANGNLGIFVTDRADLAVQLASDLRAAMAANGYTCAVGISRGEVLLFPLEDRGREIAGGPVNITSKLADDLGIPGALLVDDTIDPHECGRMSGQPFEVQVSGVMIRGFAVR